MDWAKTTARQDEKHISFVIGCAYIKDFNLFLHDHSGRIPTDNDFHHIFCNENMRTLAEFQLIIFPYNSFNDQE